jgi:hypothetical protein
VRPGLCGHDEYQNPAPEDPKTKDRTKMEKLGSGEEADQEAEFGDEQKDQKRKERPRQRQERGPAGKRGKGSKKEEEKGERRGKPKK